MRRNRLVLVAIAIAIAGGIVGGLGAMLMRPSGVGQASVEPSPSASAEPSASVAPTAPPSTGPESTVAPTPSPTGAPTAVPSVDARRPFTVTWQRGADLGEGAEVRGIVRIGGTWIATGMVWPEPAVWTSTDGLTWTRVPVQTLKTEEEYAYLGDVAAIGDLLVASGSYGAQFSDQAIGTTWISTDGGASWAENRGATRPWMAMAAGGPGLIGSNGAYFGLAPFDSWVVVSDDGREWTRIDSSLFTKSELRGFAQFLGRLYAVGSRSADDDINAIAPTAWLSTDGGATWTASELPGSDRFHQSHAGDVATTGRDLVAVGVAYGRDFAAGVVAWTTSDGSTWSYVDLASGAPATDVATVDAGFIVVAEDAGIWTSPDGRAWTALSVPGSFAPSVVGGAGDDMVAFSGTVLWRGTVDD